LAQLWATHLGLSFCPLYAAKASVLLCCLVAFLAGLRRDVGRPPLPGSQHRVTGTLALTLLSGSAANRLCAAGKTSMLCAKGALSPAVVTLAAACALTGRGGMELCLPEDLPSLLHMLLLVCSRAFPVRCFLPPPLLLFPACHSTYLLQRPLRWRLEDMRCILNVGLAWDLPITVAELLGAGHKL